MVARRHVNRLVIVSASQTAAVGGARTQRRSFPRVRAKVGEEALCVEDERLDV